MACPSGSLWIMVSWCVLWAYIVYMQCPFLPAFWSLLHHVTCISTHCNVGHHFPSFQQPSSQHDSTRSLVLGFKFLLWENISILVNFPLSNFTIQLPWFSNIKVQFHIYLHNCCLYVLAGSCNFQHVIPFLSHQAQNGLMFSVRQKSLHGTFKQGSLLDFIREFSFLQAQISVLGSKVLRASSGTSIQVSGP